jgi:hypothetical protein
MEVAAGRLAQDRDELGLRQIRNLTDARKSPLAQLPSRDRSDAPQAFHGKRMQKAELPAGRHHEEPIRLRHRAGDLGEKLRAGNSDRDRQAHPAADLSAQASRDLGR